MNSLEVLIHDKVPLLRQPTDWQTFADLGCLQCRTLSLPSNRHQPWSRFIRSMRSSVTNAILSSLRNLRRRRRFSAVICIFRRFGICGSSTREIYTDHMIRRFGLDSNSMIVEVASNDGYLLQYFQARGVPVLGVEPAGNVAESPTPRACRPRSLFLALPPHDGLELRGRA